MFSALTLNEVLENHSIFQSLHSNKSKCEAGKGHAKQLISIFGGNLFVWEEQRSCLLTTNLRATLSDENKTQKIQTLCCQNAPLFQVCSIKFISSASHVALIGSRGVTVLTLPKRWGRDAEYEGGKSIITCKTCSIADRFFTTNISVQLVQASWYPGTSSPHLCLLTSDNTFRIYNVQSDFQIPVQTHKLNQVLDGNMSISGSRMSLLSMYSVTSGLGETVIAFDFGSLIEYIPKKNLFMNKKEDAVVQLQPVYLLQGNGDVLLLLTSLTDNKYNKGILHGPLIMRPSAEDNYGTDSCAIHVMKTSPSIIVIATATGKLYHCVALWSHSVDEEMESAAELDTHSIISRSLSGVELLVDGDMIPPTLYVYEAVELELDLTLPENDPETHLISLLQDPILSCRYHCCTSVGIHSVALPWLSKLDAFVKSENENKEVLSELTEDDSCTVVHILCTKPTVSSQPCSIQGLTIATDPMFGPSLVCLTDDGLCTVLPLLNTFRPASPPLMSIIEDKTVVASPLKKLSESNFEDHVRSLLKREMSQPIIRAGDWASSSSDQECLQLVTRATQVLRDEYILNHKLARDAIVKRVRLLSDQKQQQRVELEELKEVKERLKEGAEAIADEFEDCQERQQDLMERLDAVVKRVKHTDPVLSKAEIDMGKELKALSDKLRKVDNSIKQLKVKQEYQSKQQHKREESSNMFDREKDWSAKLLQTDRFKQIILEEGEKISELIMKLNNMNAQVGL